MFLLDVPLLDINVWSPGQLGKQSGRKRDDGGDLLVDDSLRMSEDVEEVGGQADIGR